MGSQPNHFGKSGQSQAKGAPARRPEGAPPFSAKQTGKTAGKIILGAVLLYYVLHSQMIDFKSLGPALLAPKNIALSLLLLTTSALFCAFRWYQLATRQGLAVSLRTIFELTMIGNFFNTFLPGSVGGDFIKAWYIAGHSTENKTRGVFTVLLDRLIGLSVVIFYAAFSLLLFPELLRTEHRLEIIGYSVWAFTVVAGVSTLLFFTPYIWKQGWFSQAVTKMKGFGLIGKVVQAISLYRHHPGTIFKAIALSATSVLGATTLYILHGHTLGIPLSTAHYFFVVPIGMVASAIPLLPGGIGVGQVAFFTLFRLVGEVPERGATLCTLVQLHTIMFNCAGFIFYLKYKNKTQAYSIPV